MAEKESSFGIAGLQICKLLTDVAGGTATYDTKWIDIPVKSIDAGKTTTKVKEEADETVYNTEIITEEFTINWENAMIPFEAFEVINGSEVGATATGSTVLIEKKTDVSGTFAVRFISKKTFANKGPMGVFFGKVNGNLTMKPVSKEFLTCSFEGEAVPRLSDGIVKKTIILEAGKGIEDVTEANMVVV